MMEDKKISIQKKAKKEKKKAAKNRIMFGEEINLDEAKKRQQREMKNFAKIDEI